MNYSTIEQSIKDAIKEAVYQNTQVGLEDVRLVQPPSPEMGDISFACFEIAGQYPKDRQVSSSQVANWIKGYIEQKLLKGKFPYIKSVHSTGAYVNVFITDTALFQGIVEDFIVRGEKTGDSTIGQKETVILEYSGPNTNKPQHIGHLRNNCLGDSMSRILSSQGWNTKRVNIINDRGMHICKSMLMYQQYGEGRTPEEMDKKPDHFVGYFYELFEKKNADLPKSNGKTELDAAIQEMLKRWEDGDIDIRALWKKMNTWVYEGWRYTYGVLGITFDKVYYESDIYELGKQIVQEGLQKGVFYKRGDGAIEISLESEGLDKKVLVRADCTSVYITMDLALAKLRWEDFPFATKLIYVVDYAQEYHFKVLFSCLEKLGYKTKDAYEHLSYGRVNLATGKMSSRLGNVVSADEVIENVVGLALLEMEKRLNTKIVHENDIVVLLDCYIDNLKKLSDEEHRAVKIGLAAIKYYILSVDPKKDITFDPHKAVQFEGATGPYILYTYARMRSIMQKSNIKMQNDKSKIKDIVLNKEEREIVNKLAQFQLTLQKAATEYNPAYLAHYLYELAELINSFYHKHQVLRAEDAERDKRLALLTACGTVLKKGLRLLGIGAVERM